MNDRNHHDADAAAERIRVAAVNTAAMEILMKSPVELAMESTPQPTVAQLEEIATRALIEKNARLKPVRDALNDYCVSLMSLPLTGHENADTPLHTARLAFVRSIGRISECLE